MKRTGGLKRSELKRKKPMKRSHPAPRRTKKNVSSWWFSDAPQAVFHQTAREQRVCAVTGTTDPWQAHHVVERRHLKKKREWIFFEWDPRNALRLTTRVHERHTNAVEKVPLSCLTDENIAFAFELMGLAAEPYLKRHYAGDDKRVALAVAEFGAPDAAG